MTTNQPPGSGGGGGGGAVPPHLARPEVQAALEATRAKFALQQQRAAQQQQQQNGSAQPQPATQSQARPAPLSARTNPMFGEVRRVGQHTEWRACSCCDGFAWHAAPSSFRSRLLLVECSSTKLLGSLAAAGQR